LADIEQLFDLNSEFTVNLAELLFFPFRGLANNFLINRQNEILIVFKRYLLPVNYFFRDAALMNLFRATKGLQ
jgi:hypothetical protein